MVDVIVNIGKSIANSLNTIPTVETLLLPSNQTEKTFLKTSLPEHIAQPFYTQLVDIVNDLFQAGADIYYFGEN